MTAVDHIDAPPQVEPEGLARLLLRADIEDFYYGEARLLDDWAVAEWVELFTDDVHYWAPVRSNRIGREIGREIAGPEEGAFFDEDRGCLLERVYRIESQLAWAEQPRSRLRHFITNVEIIEDRETEGGRELLVYSNFLVYRGRLETQVNIWSGKREDVLRAVDGSWRIARRKIVFDHSTNLAENLGVMF